MRKSARWWLASAALLAAYALSPREGRLVLYRVIGLLPLVAVAALVASRRVARPLPWLLIAAGVLAWVLGDLLWDLSAYIWKVQPSPSPADVLYLAGYPLMAAGLGVIARRRSPSPDQAGLVDAAIITIGSGVLAWAFLLVPYARDETLTQVEKAMAMGYPLGDLLLLALAVRVFLTPGHRSPAYRLLAAGLLVTLATDIVYSAQTLNGGGLLTSTAQDLGWLAGYLLIAGAALHPSVSDIDAPARPVVALTDRRLGALALASLLAPATLAYQTLGGQRVDGILIAISASALFGLVVLRMSGLVRHIQAQSRELAALARTDALTGLPNRRAWDDELAHALARAARLDEPLCLALVDLDFFKRFNDAHGHPEGDRLLREAAAHWGAELRASDVLARYGGEEFGVLLPGCSPADAERMIVRLRAATPSGQTCSAGVAVWDGRESAAELVARADAALYRAKKSGRDRARVA